MTDSTYPFDYCIARALDGMNMPGEEGRIYARLWINRAKLSHEADMQDNVSALVEISEASDKSNVTRHPQLFEPQLPRPDEDEKLTEWLGIGDLVSLAHGDYSKEADDVAKDFDIDSRKRHVR